MATLDNSIQCTFCAPNKLNFCTQRPRCYITYDWMDGLSPGSIYCGINSILYTAPYTLFAIYIILDSKSQQSKRLEIENEQNQCTDGSEDPRYDCRLEIRCEERWMWWTRDAKDEKWMQTKIWRLKDVDLELLSVCTWSASQKNSICLRPWRLFFYMIPLTTDGRIAPWVRLPSQWIGTTIQRTKHYIWLEILWGKIR